MPQVDFTKVGDLDDFEPIPTGEYVCVLGDIEEVRKRDGSEIWKVRWFVEAGPYKGRTVFDSLAFTSAALKRVKRLCRVAEIDTSASVHLTPSMLLQTRALLRVELSEYVDRTGRERRSNVAAFDAYASPPDVEEEADEDDEPPF